MDVVVTKLYDKINSIELIDSIIIDIWGKFLIDMPTAGGLASDIIITNPNLSSTEFNSDEILTSIANDLAKKSIVESINTIDGSINYTITIKSDISSTTLEPNDRYHIILAKMLCAVDFMNQLSDKSKLFIRSLYEHSGPYIENELTLAMYDNAKKALPTRISSVNVVKRGYINNNITAICKAVDDAKGNPITIYNMTTNNYNNYIQDAIINLAKSSNNSNLITKLKLMKDGKRDSSYDFIIIFILISIVIVFIVIIYNVFKVSPIALAGVIAAIITLINLALTYWKTL